MSKDSLPGRKGQFVFHHPDLRRYQVRQIKHDEKREWQIEAADECREGKLDGCIWPDCQCYPVDTCES